MCQHLIILAKHSAKQHVGQCEHGTVHLAWGFAMLAMRADDFTQLATQLATCMDRNDFATMQSGPFRMFCTPHGTFQLWIGTVGLYLTLGDLATFAQMLDDARQLLAHALMFPFCHSTGLGSDFQIMQVQEPGAFVAN